MRVTTKPYAGATAAQTAKIDECVKAVMRDQGYDKSRAIAFCYASIVKSKAVAVKQAPRWKSAARKAVGNEVPRAVDAMKSARKLLDQISTPLGAAQAVGKLRQSDLNQAQQKMGVVLSYLQDALDQLRRAEPQVS